MGLQDHTASLAIPLPLCLSKQLSRAPRVTGCTKLKGGLPMSSNPTGNSTSALTHTFPGPTAGKVTVPEAANASRPLGRREAVLVLRLRFEGAGDIPHTQNAELQGLERRVHRQGWGMGCWLPLLSPE